MTLKPKELDGQLARIHRSIERAVQDGDSELVNHRWRQIKNNNLKEMIEPHLSAEAREILDL